MITVPVTTEVDITVYCSECERPLPIHKQEFRSGMIVIYADACTCPEKLNTE